MLLDLDIVIGFKLERISIYFVVVVVVLVLFVARDKNEDCLELD